MTELLTSWDVAKILKVSRRTAVRYMRRMEHMEHPLRVERGILNRWIWNKISPAPEGKAMRKRSTTIIARKEPVVNDP